MDGHPEDGPCGGLFDPTERETVSYPGVTRIDLAAATIGPQKTPASPKRASTTSTTAT